MGVLDKAAAVLDVIGRDSASPSEIAAATGIPRNTVARLVRAMIRLGLAARQEDGQIAPGPRIARPGATTDEVPTAGSGIEKLAALRDATGASAVRLVRRRGPADTARVCIAEVLDLHAAGRSQLGVPVPFADDPVTRTFLAWQYSTDRAGPAPHRTAPYTADMLAQTRRRGWAQGFSGPTYRLATVAAPVLDRSKELVGVLVISGPVTALTETPGRVHGRTLLKVASASEVISECLYRSGTPVSRLHLLTAKRRGTV
ncbi:helix-turn-helix domain-containing protein [Streptomyces sparsogenes]|uniref:IclR family transcriptional regulator n=1 Tax=Streptomyces sparsogenes DSM 40356 TaxID=1331668 RepID=A0A1R1S5J0_9ACTN|nr:helix-turn-helix domain-containing protein [Streptomyces sparsogenes]OMI33555.1 IclR family transcriptional regulator [Streptomyces sparsogenes DSM 40356]